MAPFSYSLMQPELDLDSLLDSLPPSLKNHLQQLLTTNDSDQTRKSLENLLKFILGNPHPATSNDTQSAWEHAQSIWKNKLNTLTNGSISVKRPLDQDAESNGKSKKPKLEVSGEPLFTVHGISVATPIRKKMDVTIGTSAITLTLPGSDTLEASIALTDLNRAFLLSTPGKAKPHHTIVLMNDGTFSKDKDTKSTDLPHIIFGIDATLTTPLKATAHTPSSSSTTHPKASPSLPLLLEFFSHLPSTFPFYDTSRATFRSAVDKSECGITAYLGAKEGHLYFFKEGILWGEKKPCMWYGIGDLERAKAWTVTGRNASLYLEQVHEGDLEEDEPPPSIEFSMIDGKEIGGMQDWIATAQSSFGSSKSGTSAAVATKTTSSSKAAKSSPLSNNKDPAAPAPRTDTGTGIDAKNVDHDDATAADAKVNRKK